MNLREAKYKENLLKENLLQLDDWYVEFTLTFKHEFMRQFDWTFDRINEGKDLLKWICKRLKINKKQISFFLKDEFQHGSGHLHGLAGGKIFQIKNITATQIVNVIKEYWEGHARKRTIRFKENESTEWVKQRVKVVVSPNKGYCRVRSLRNKKEEDLVNLISYSSKFTKGKNVVGVMEETNDVLRRRILKNE